MTGSDTARVIVNANNQKVWLWDSAPFGDTAANEQPTAGIPNFTFNLRFPGQQYDRETGTHYNYFRDYEAQTGRYVQSDPIGLWGGFDTYTYVGSRAPFISDPLGLMKPPPGTMSGPVVFTIPANADPDEFGEMQKYCDSCNSALKGGKLSKTGRVSTAGPMRDAADSAAEKERRRAIAAGTPYGGKVAGHGPDTTWTGQPEPPCWLPISRRLNSSLGRQAQDYPIGYKPTDFSFIVVP